MDGERIGGRYEIRRPIGSGGMAQVYLAFDVVLGREVAVKVLKPESAADSSYVERFRREGHAAAALNHPNIIAVYDWGEESGTYYMVMEYVAGEDLKELIQRRGPLPEDEALAIAAQIAAALEAAHRQGIIHRDVKPHNVLLASDGRVKVTDFGIARKAGLSQLTEANAVCGTLPYLAPEQAQLECADSRSDVYSLGVVLYEMLTGVFPFSGDSLVEVTLQQIQKPAPAPTALRPGISTATDRIILKALDKEPDRRFQTAAAMRDALTAARDALVTRPERSTRRGALAGGKPAPRASGFAAQKTAVPVRPARRMEEVGTSRRRKLTGLIAVPLILILSLAAVALAQHALNGGHTAAGRGHSSTQRTATTTGGSAPASSRHHTQPGSTAKHPASGRSMPTPSPAAHRAVVVPPATSRPTAIPAATTPPRPTATAGPTAAPAPTAPPNLASASSGAGDPASAVVSFYQLVAQGAYDQAAQLWSPTMQASYPPAQNITQRFSNVDHLTVRGVHVVAQSASSATVAVDVVEVDGSPPVTREWIGTWDLVRGQSGWLLNQPNLHQG